MDSVAQAKKSLQLSFLLDFIQLMANINSIATAESVARALTDEIKGKTGD